MVSRAKLAGPLPNADLSTILTVSIDHICTSTAALLESEANGTSNTILLTVGNWGTYGWFMWVPEDADAPVGNLGGDEFDLPADLYHIFVYAKQAGADYLLIDVDAAVNPDLPVYPEE